MDDLRGRAVVLLESHDRGARPAAGEVEDVRDLGAPPGVDRLVVVAHHAEAAVVAGQRRDDPFLDAAGVLIFVDEQVIEPRRLGLSDILVLGEKIVHHQQKVVEIDGAGRPQGLLVAAVSRGGQFPGVAGIGREGRERAVGPHRRALPAADAVEQVAGAERGLRHLQLLEHLPGGRLLLPAIDDGKPAGEAHPRGMAPEDADAERVDRGDLRLLVAACLQKLAGTGEHLLRGLVGEGDGQNSRRPRAAPDEVGDPRDHDAGLAGAGSGQHQERSHRRPDGLGLRRIEAGRRLPWTRRHVVGIHGTRNLPHASQSGLTLRDGKSLFLATAAASSPDWQPPSAAARSLP